jgi:hypothetical protein
MAAILPDRGISSWQRPVGGIPGTVYLIVENEGDSCRERLERNGVYN